jgi:autotransporter translocation and assembly factor TamB
LLNGDFNIKNSAKINVNSGGNLNANIITNQLNFEGTSGSNSTIKGNVLQANFQVTSAANCSAQNLNVENASANAISAANLTVNVSGTLTASASSGGKIRYKGNPSNIIQNVNSISGGKLIKY